MNSYDEQYYFLKYNEEEKKIHDKAFLSAVEKYKIPRETSWIETDIVCKDCDYNIVVCQTSEPGTDYWYYCSNKSCKNHKYGEQLGDQEECSFAKDAKVDDI